MIKKISKYPAMERDVNITVNKNIPYSEVEKRFCGIEYLESFNLIDLFKKNDEKVFTIRLTFVSYDKCLTGICIDKLVKRINETS